MKTWALVAVAAMGLTACQNDFEEQVEAKDSVVVTFVADSADTRTSVDTSGATPEFTWDVVENFYVLEQTADTFEAVNTDQFELNEGKAYITAEFAANPGKGEYKYVTIYPEDGYVDATDINNATLTLPAEQEMLTPNSYGVSDLMVSEVVTTNSQPAETQPVRFTRLAAVVQLTLKNLSAEEQIESVTFEAAGKHLAGEIVVDLNKPHEFDAGSESSSSVKVVAHPDVTRDIYFTVLPTTLEAGKTYTVTVVTDKKIYIKTGTIPAEKSLVFDSGMVTRVGVNMADVEGIDKWTLVRDASTLKEGDVVAIVAKDYDKALSTNLYSNASETSTSARRDATDASKMGEYLLASADVQPFVLVTGSVEGTFAFYDETRAKFLVSNNSSSRYLINQAYISAETCFAISINAEDGDATIENTEGNYPDNKIRYYNSSKYFYSGTSANQAVCIYRLEGAVGTIPTVAANVTVPDNDESVVIAEEGATTATAIEEVVFNYVGDWTISASASESWLTVSYADGSLSYTAEVNTGAPREATVTITAKLEGQTDLTWTFNVLQKGVPQEISIAEFMSKKSDVNTTYKLTGKITEMTSSSSGTYKLTDGTTNVVTITYLYTDNGDKVYGDESIGLEVGDVVTVTTVAATSTAGKGGSSAYHSIYKGHYGIDASAGVAADYTGGEVTIEVTTRKGGSMTFPEAVVATMPESDYATLTYDGGDTATVTFTSENTTSDAREATVTFTYGAISVEVTVEQGINPANRVGWNLVTDASTLKTGDEIVIVAKNVDKALGCLASSSNATGVSNFPAVEVDKSGNVVYDVEKAGALVFTLKDGNSAGTFALQFTHKDTNYYLYAPSSGLKGRAASSGANDDTSYEIIIDATSGDATVENARPKVVKYNNATGTAFLAYSPTAANATKEEFAICIYRK